MIRRYLHQRYPIVENKWKIILPVALFIGFFMVVFQPFGVHQVGGNPKLIFLGGFGVVTGIVLIINLFLIPLVIPGWFREERWTVIRELLFFLWILLTLGLANLLYTSWLTGIRFAWGSIIAFQVFTLAIGIIPLTVLTIVKQNYLGRKFRENAADLSGSLIRHPENPASGAIVTLFSENRKEQVNIAAGNLIAIQSDGNYITVIYLTGGKPSSTLLRNTLKAAEQTLANCTDVYKCHRSWLVNLNRISRVSGTSQGLRLHMDDLEESIPVARGNSAEIRQRLTQQID